VWGLYYGLRFIARPSTKRAAIAGAALALAICCKFSCLLLLPALILIAIARIVLSPGRAVMFRRLFQPRRAVLLIAVGFLVTWAVYGFAVNPMRQQAMLVHEPVWTRIPEVIREQPIPMPSFWLGQLFLASRAGSSGQTTYLNGQISFTGWTAYFPEALAVKEPVGFLLALLAAVIIFSVVKRRRHVLLSAALLIPILLFFAASMHSRYQLGIRHLLPILPLMYLFAVSQFVRIQRTGLLLPLMLLAWMETAWIHPDYLAFFNFACGGPTRGDRYLLDSNLDWGQDMARLATWLKSADAGGKPYSIRCSYVTARELHELGLDPASLTAPPHGLFAISKNVEHRFESVERDEIAPGGIHLGEDYSWLSRYPVVKRIGYSIDVYDLDAKNLREK
jgi:hypothetical protein